MSENGYNCSDCKKSNICDCCANCKHVHNDELCDLCIHPDSRCRWEPVP